MSASRSARSLIILFLLSSLVFPLVEAQTQFARPDADQATGDWVSTPLWSKVDDDLTAQPSGDGVTINNGVNNANSFADLRLSDITDPQSSSGHIIRARWAKSSSGGTSITAFAELWEGIPGTGSLRATLSAADPNPAEQTDIYTLSVAEADAIGNYADLYIRLYQTGGGGSPSKRRGLIVEAAEFEVPEAPSWSNTAPSIDQSFTTREGGHNISYNEALTATDPDANQTLTWSLNTNASFLALEQADRSAWTNGTPVFADRDASYFVEVTVDDGGCAGSCALTDVLNWTLYINDTAPVLSNPIATDEGGHNISYSRDFEFTDANSDAGIWSLESNASFLSINTAGTVSGTPTFADRDSTFYTNATILDYEGGLSDSTNYTLYVNNTAPVLSNPILTDEAGHNISYSRDFDFTDANSDTGIWSLESNGTFLSIDVVGTVSGMPAFADRDSQFYVNAIITDYEGGLSDSTNYTLYINDTAPIISNPITEDTGSVDTPYSRDFDFTDANSDTGIWSLDSNASFLSIDSAGTVSGTPDIAGTYYVNATITDYEGGLTDAVNYTLIVTAGGGDPPPGDGDSGFIPSPVAYFLHNNDIMNPGLVHFTYDGEGIARTFLWDFGDNSKRSFERDPVHRYHFFLYDQWIVRLQVCGPTGCDEMTTTVALVDYRAVAFLVLGAVIILGGAIQTMKRRKI